MSENKHTPEPWAYYDDRKSTGRIEIVGLGKTVSRIYLSVPDEDVANARRITACVNACAGIPISDLESGDFAKSLKMFALESATFRRQRDELLAALGSGGRHCNDDTPHSDLCEAIIDSKEADLGQGLDPFWKWAFRRGFHEAETSYKVDIATLEQQRDELLAALERFMDSHEECTDFDGFTAQTVSMADYHQAQEAIARSKGEQ